MSAEIRCGNAVWYLTRHLGQQARCPSWHETNREINYGTYVISYISKKSSNSLLVIVPCKLWVVRRGPLCFLDGCHKRRLNEGFVVCGLVDRFNQTCKKMLHHVIQPHDRQWHKFLCCGYLGRFLMPWHVSCHTNWYIVGSRKDPWWFLKSYGLGNPVPVLIWVSQLRTVWT